MTAPRSLEEACTEAKRILNEDIKSYPGWEQIETEYEGIEKIYSRIYCVTPDGKTNVMATKGTIIVEASAKEIFDVYWNPNTALRWDVSTVSKVSLLEDGGNTQLIHQEHKVLSAAVPKRDLLFKRAYQQTENGYFVYGLSVESPRMPKLGSFARAILYFSGFLIEEKEPNVCHVTSIFCFDFNGWIHVKFTDQEKTKVALRLSRFQKLVHESIPRKPVQRITRNSGYKPQEKLTSSISTNQRNYNDYVQTLRDVAPGLPSDSAPAPTQAPIGTTVHGINGCSTCKCISPGTFCPECGDRVYPVCSSCFSAIRADARFCPICGFKLH